MDQLHPLNDVVFMKLLSKPS